MLIMRKVLILGAKGMLGQELVRVYTEDDGYQVTSWDIEDVDITDFASVEQKVRGLMPEIVINAVAYNAVDLCEESDEEYQKARLLNASVPKFLALLSKKIGAILVHYSTDYVFDGEKKGGYREEDQPRPLSHYGMSKREGEKNVITEWEKNDGEEGVQGKEKRNEERGGERGLDAKGGFYIIRLSKLFGKPASSAAGKKSFFEKMLEASQGKPEITVVDDEKSCFTYAPDLALATKILIQDQVPYGIYHLTNDGAATWYEAAKELFRLAGKEVTVVPVGSDAFPRPAKRPRQSELLNTKWIAFRHYTEALEEFLKNQ